MPRLDHPTKPASSRRDTADALPRGAPTGNTNCGSANPVTSAFDSSATADRPCGIGPAIASGGLRALASSRTPGDAGAPEGCSPLVEANYRAGWVVAFWPGVADTS